MNLANQWDVIKKQNLKKAIWAYAKLADMGFNMEDKPLQHAIYPLEIRVYPYGVEITESLGNERDYYLIQGGKLVQVDERLFVHDDDEPYCW